MPVANTASSMRVRAATLRRLSLRKAPLPRSDQNRSPLAGLKVRAATTWPSRCRAMLIAKCGMAWRKLVVPSSGSTIQVWVLSVPSTKPRSSPRGTHSPGAPWSALSIRVCFGLEVGGGDEIGGRLLLRHLASATSPKSRASARPALRAASVITRMSALAAATISGTPRRRGWRRERAPMLREQRTGPPGAGGPYPAGAIRLKARDLSKLCHRASAAQGRHSRPAAPFFSTQRSQRSWRTQRRRPDAPNSWLIARFARD